MYEPSERDRRLDIAWHTSTNIGGNGEEDPPVLIPNTEVKLFIAESTWLDTAREDRTLPISIKPFTYRWAVLLWKKINRLIGGNILLTAFGAAAAAVFGLVAGAVRGLFARTLYAFDYLLNRQKQNLTNQNHFINFKFCHFVCG